ncbi:Uncharacterised protein [Klebsiella pneumoniae subsp. pneumoniae]|uniref:Uncharacterized protein n=1 Tax=Klebsiella pneumoniae subsp. pneumoniae TaxID=72407 RepID=A0A378A131_KLEPN|nr:Uncharacterised protein [Klebsiella pneumoniae subsp. pneumoniae]
MNRAADHYDEFYLWQTIKLAGNGSRLLAPRLRQGLDHRVITILFLPEDDVKRALNQLSLMLQQPLTANDNPPVIATMKPLTATLRVSCSLPNGWDDTTQPGNCWLRFATSVVRSC